MLSNLTAWVRKTFDKYLQVDQKDKVKLVFFSISFFLIIGSYSILRSLKNPIFNGFIGVEYQPYTRFISMLLIVPCLIGYAKLVDKAKRHQIVYVILSIYTILSFVFTIFLAHPTIGIQNTYTSPYRMIGWAFEIYMDLYSALVVSTFWGFVNSTCTTEFARKNYGLIVAASRIGGITTPMLSLLMTTGTTIPSHHSIPLLIFIAGLLLAGATLCIATIVKKVPEENLHGYEAAYQVEKKEKTKKKSGLFEGLKIILKEPYVLGIFGLVYCIEVISILCDYQWQVLISLKTNNNIGEMSSFMFLYTAIFQCLGFMFALFGTAPLLRKIGVRSCLLIIPVVSLILIGSFIVFPYLSTIFIVLVVLRALNYGFNQPVREILYIPTVKDVQFKSKAWIESFGKTFSKASGSVLTIASTVQNPMACIYANSLFSLVISVVYLFASFFMGKRYNNIIKTNSIIGKKV